MMKMFGNQRSVRPPGKPGRPRGEPRETVGQALAATHRALLVLMETLGGSGVSVPRESVDRLARNRRLMSELPSGMFAEAVEELEARLRRQQG